MTQTPRKTRTRRRTASKEVRQGQLIKATIRSIARHGLSETTIATVANEAGLSQGIINLHFQSKDRLLMETLRYLSEQYREAWEKAVAKAGDSPADKLAAMVLLAELGDISRFESPKQLMAYLGLVPSEHSSGGSRRQGGITRTGNGHVRRVLVEAAWHYRKRAGADLIMTRRRMGQDPRVVSIAIKAQHRLQRKFWKVAERKHTCKEVTATARELCGFIWSALVVEAQEA